jgi:potassium/hydrogen antiporter
MSDVERFALIELITAGCGRGRGAVQPGQRTHPGPPTSHLPAGRRRRLRRHPRPRAGSVTTVQRVVTVALAVILVDGGIQIGWRQFRQAAGAVVWVGVAGTFVTAAALATLAHILFGLE